MRKNASRDNSEQSLIAHLTELRSRLLHCLTFILLVFFGLFYFASDIYYLISTPLLKQLPPKSAMIATQVSAPFLTPFKLTLFIAIFLSMPYLLYQAWAFIAPGLYKNEQRFVLPLVGSSIILFYTGTAFAFFIVMPLLFNFFTSVAPEGVLIMTDINHYLNFILKIFFAFGLAFEVPIATMLIVWSGFASAQTLARNRPYIIVIAFVIGMLLTPPDVISQVLLALPIWLLFELGLLLSRKFITTTAPKEDSHTANH